MNRRIIFFGTPDFAAVALEALLEAGYEVAAVVTQPDKPAGRGKRVQFPPVKAAALAHGIEALQPERVRRPEAIEALRGYKADLFIVAAFGQILPKELLAMPPLGCINIHASLLPKYRGAAPIQWAVINGEKETGVTLMQMDEGLDTGAILATCVVPVGPKETGASLFDKLARAGAKLLIDTLPELEAGRIKPLPQNDADSSYAAMIKKEMGEIDWRKPAIELERLVRGLDSWPGAYTRLRGKTLKIWEADAEEGLAGGEPGKVVRAAGETFKIQTGEGFLALRNVQLEGKKRMEVKSFLLGCPVTEGEVLGRPAGEAGLRQQAD